MSKLQKLIQELCPDGVEYKTLGEIGTFTRGNGLQKKDFTESGVGCIHYGQIYTHYGFYTTQTKSFVDESLAHKLTKVQKGNLIIACTSENIEDVCKAVVWLGNEDIVTGGHACVFAHNENPKYISYFFQTEMFFQQKRKYARGAKVIDIKVSDLSKIEIPVPPPPVQEEIVRILDHFTTLAAELQAELQARKEQYEYYRSQLLTFEKDAEGVKWKSLPDICENLDRKRKAVTASNRTFGPYPYYGASGIVDYVNSYIFEGNYLLISEDGANLLARSTPIAFSISGKSWVNNHAHVLEFQNMFTQKYIEHYINMIDISQYVSGGAQPKLNQENLNKIPIPVPSPSEQRRIVAILNNFETLVNDLSQGLPAEISAVQEQYEYYRNKILSFPRIKIGA